MRKYFLQIPGQKCEKQKSLGWNMSKPSLKKIVSMFYYAEKKTHSIFFSSESQWGQKMSDAALDILCHFNLTSFLNTFF